MGRAREPVWRMRQKGSRKPVWKKYHRAFFSEFLETTWILFWSTKVNIGGENSLHCSLQLIATDADADGYADGYIRYPNEEENE